MALSHRERIKSLVPPRGTLQNKIKTKERYNHHCTNYRERNSRLTFLFIARKEEEGRRGGGGGGEIDFQVEPLA